MVTWVREHLPLTVAALVVAVLLAAFVLIWFQPQKLFIDQRVSEALPEGAVASAADEDMADDDMASEEDMADDDMASEEDMADDDMASEEEADASAQPATLASGEFTGTAHPTSGTASAIRLEDGSRILRFEEFATDNGPDLLVYLTSASPDAGDDAFDQDFVSLGPLKGNLGDQNYELPDDVDLERYATVVIWCRRFTVSFGTASLDAAG
ncbi:MAG TPA: DM13 domain-containing protein [Egibacteraceae bacterium]|nr:DM13 domain-containing protein [Egibacteraceae bacterium]